jgi:hypothetical protein
MIFFEGYTDGMKWIIFFYAFVPSVIIFFITNGFTDRQKITDKRFIDGAFPSVISLVN